MPVKESVQRLRENIQSHIIGQERLVDRLLIALLADGHLLIEGVPGLAKTRAIKVLGMAIEGDFHRVQFTPDLLPADITGTEIYRPQDSSFVFQQGPIFHNFILADEINRAPAKVQSALLEAMGERQITVGRETYQLPKLFLVMATQNPLEQEGTYPLPEAQLDRFLMHVEITYPEKTQEHEILQLARNEARTQDKAITPDQPNYVISAEELFFARDEVLDIYMAENVEQYLLQFVLATRDPTSYGDDLLQWIEYGVSPRGTITLDRCARAHAWLNGRDFVSPEDIQAMVKDVFRHRIIVSYAAEADGVTADVVVDKLLERIAVP